MTAAETILKRPITREITLEFPVTVDGREYKSIWITRLTAKDVQDFQKEIAALLENNPDAGVTFPIFRDLIGERIPQEVLDALDDDDRLALDEAAIDFLPRRFRGVVEAGSGLTNGAATGHTSGASSDGR